MIVAEKSGEASVIEKVPEEKKKVSMCPKGSLAKREGEGGSLKGSQAKIIRCSVLKRESAKGG